MVVELVVVVVEVVFHYSSFHALHLLVVVET